MNNEQYETDWKHGEPEYEVDEGYEIDKAEYMRGDR